MRYLANQNVPADAVMAARSVGHDVQWGTELAPGSSDDDVLRQASADSRVLITFDKDFGELVYRLGRKGSSGIILLRPQLRSPGFLARFLLAVLAAPIVWEGNFSVAEEGRIRVIPLPE